MMSSAFLFRLNFKPQGNYLRWVFLSDVRAYLLILFFLYPTVDDISLNTKTICFGVVGTIFSPRKPMLLLTKTNCFGVMMLYDAFVKRVTSVTNRV